MLVADEGTFPASRFLLESGYIDVLHLRQANLLNAGCRTAMLAALSIFLAFSRSDDDIQQK